MGLREHVPQSVAAKGRGGPRRFKRPSLWSAGGRSPSSLSQPGPRDSAPPTATASSARTQKSARRCGGAANRRVMASDLSVPAPPPLASLSLLSGAYHRVDSAMLRSALLSHPRASPSLHWVGWGWTLYKSRLLGLAPPPQEKKKNRKTEKFRRTATFLDVHFSRRKSLSLFCFRNRGEARAQWDGAMASTSDPVVVILDDEPSPGLEKEVPRRLSEAGASASHAAAERRRKQKRKLVSLSFFFFSLFLSRYCSFFFFFCVHGDA